MFQPLPVFVGLRYSLAREHSFFVSFISWVSLLGVAVGVAALITVLSVMNGFESELRERLLSGVPAATHAGEFARQIGGARREFGSPKTFDLRTHLYNPGGSWRGELPFTAAS